MPEATENQLRAEALVADLFNDPELRAKVAAKAKIKFTDFLLPEDNLKPVLEKFESDTADMRTQLQALATWKAEREKADQDTKAFTSLQDDVDKAVREYSLTEDGKAKMLERMKEKSNFDADAAAAWVASKTPPAQVSGPTWAPQDLNLFGSKNKDENLAALHQNPQKYMDDQLWEFTKDPDKYVAETFGQ